MRALTGAGRIASACGRLFQQITDGGNGLPPDAPGPA